MEDNRFNINCDTFEIHRTFNDYIEEFDIDNMFQEIEGMTVNAAMPHLLNILTTLIERRPVEILVSEIYTNPDDIHILVQGLMPNHQHMPDDQRFNCFVAMFQDIIDVIKDYPTFYLYHMF
jgi:hypothetical protein